MFFYQANFKIGKSLAVLVVIIGLAAGATLASKKENQIEINANKSTFKTANKNTITTGEANKDSDGDGLMDWEEKIYGTDPQNPDTDGDGHLDGEEIANGYNPLVKAPGDRLSDFPLNPANSQNDSNNLTNRLMATLAQKIIELNKERQDDNQGMAVPNPRKLIADFLKNVPADEYNFSAEKDFDPAKIKISKDNSKAAARKYLENFGSIIKRSFSSSDKLGKHIVRDAYQSEDFTEFDKLISAYESAINEFYGLTVPSGWAELHEEEIKLLISTKKVYEAMRYFKKDPAKTALAVRGYYVVAFQSRDLKEKINSKAATDKI